MTPTTTYVLRRIFKSAVTSQSVIRELLQIMFLTALLDPGDEVWIVSPWISNVQLLDNRAGGFDAVNPEWRRREIRLVDVVVQLLTAGSRVTLVTRPDEHNRAFVERLCEAAQEAGVDELLSVVLRDTLHTKGILTGSGLLMGSMNLTYNGLELNDEVVEYDTDPAGLASARLAFQLYRDASP